MQGFVFLWIIQLCPIVRAVSMVVVSFPGCVGMRLGWQGTNHR